VSGRREVLLAAGGSLLLALVMTWPLVLNLGDAIPRDLGDPLAQSWKVAWAGHALISQPLDYFQANQFYPERDSFAFGDMLIGYAPFGLFTDGSRDAVTRYDLVFIFAYAMAFFGAYVLARELGVGPAGAAVAGAAFAFAPLRLEHDGHMQVISTGGIPLALGLAVRGVRLRRPWVLLGAWAVAAWQVSIGFALGLPFAYALAGGIAIAALVWWRRGRPPVERGMLVAGAAGALLFTVVTALIAAPHIRIADRHPEAIRTPEVVESFSEGPRALTVASPENAVWGPLTEGAREDLVNIAEKALFPGLLILALAAIGLGSSVLPRWLRLSLAAAAVGFAILSFGFRVDDGLLWPYRWLYELLPGWEGIRTPGRLFTFTTLALALLAAAGAESLLAALRRRLGEEPPPEREASPESAAGSRAGPGRAAVLTAVLAAALALAVVVEGRGLPFDPFDDQPQPALVHPAVSTADVPDPQLHLPAGRDKDNRRYVLWSTDGYPRIVNGRASTTPEETIELIGRIKPFPSPASVAELRALGVRSVVLHTNRLGGTPWDDSAAVPVEGLGLRRSERPGLVIFELEPAPLAAGEDG